MKDYSTVCKKDNLCTHTCECSGYDYPLWQGFKLNEIQQSRFDYFKDVFDRAIEISLGNKITETDRDLLAHNIASQSLWLELGSAEDEKIFGKLNK